LRQRKTRARTCCGKIRRQQIFVTGNTVIDALIWVRDRVLANDELRAELQRVILS
jgi:UDP-N-acetylglucosamine 2-epimerase (non-hydrolysing)